ncbi:hypothetical protein DF038_03280 [Burkholderia cepacia]|nr:hypothetical protein DF038_03280 [Burkholderia cepacia]
MSLSECLCVRHKLMAKEPLYASHTKFRIGSLQAGRPRVSESQRCRPIDHDHAGLQPVGAARAAAPRS